MRAVFAEVGKGNSRFEERKEGYWTLRGEGRDGMDVEDWGLLREARGGGGEGGICKKKKRRKGGKGERTKKKGVRISDMRCDSCVGGRVCRIMMDRLQTSYYQGGKVIYRFE